MVRTVFVHSRVNVTLTELAVHGRPGRKASSACASSAHGDTGTFQVPKPTRFSTGSVKCATSINRCRWRGMALLSRWQVDPSSMAHSRYSKCVHSSEARGLRRTAFGVRRGTVRWSHYAWRRSVILTPGPTVFLLLSHQLVKADEWTVHVGFRRDVRLIPLRPPE